jgi:hypothetical protein
MASDSEAVWEKDGKELTGRWFYDWAADKFHVSLDAQPKGEAGFRNLDFCVHGDSPEFSGWKLVRKIRKQDA